MKKLSFLVCLFVLSLVATANADRNLATVKVFSSSQLVKRGDGKIYSITFVATSNNGDFTIFDDTEKNDTPLTSIKAEGKEATSGNSQYQDHKEKPLEFSTGIYVVIANGYLLLEYE